jgi:hypothetical protein
MAKTSEESRRNVFPVLLSQLDGPPAAALEQISAGKRKLCPGNEIDSIPDL